MGRSPKISDAELARRLWALGDPMRLHLLRLLPRPGATGEPPNVTRLSEMLGLSQPTTSHHLRVLRQAGFIAGHRVGREMVYVLRPDEVRATADAACAFLNCSAGAAGSGGSHG